MGIWIGVKLGTMIAVLAVVACGESSKGNSVPTPTAGETGAGAGTGGTASTSTDGGASSASAAGVSGAGAYAGAGTSCEGGACPSPAAVTPAQACRAYFSAVCARIRACGAPLFRPCESPIDLCPDILFGEGSGFTMEGVVQCTEQWKNHPCEALETAQGPACSEIPGGRPTGAPCVFDSQCRTRRCRDGIVPMYQASCGVCTEVAESHGACTDERVCPVGQWCDKGLCADAVVARADACSGVVCPAEQTCRGGACVPLLPAGSECTRASKCSATLGCEIELVPESMPEPTSGICRPLPAIGEPCLPTFGRVGACAPGGTCNSRPTGTCVPLVQIGGSCGFTSCVEGAYCNIYGYEHVRSHVCHALGQVGDPCDGTSEDHGKAGCAKALDCRCDDADCATASCQPSPHGEDSCPRFTAFGREYETCPAGDECLCTDTTCESARCGVPRDFGESCDGAEFVCRQGLACVAGRCAEAERDLEALSCSKAAPSGE